MPLTPEEELERRKLLEEVGGATTPSSQLSADERKELEALRQELGGPQSTQGTASTSGSGLLNPERGSRAGGAWDIMAQATGLPSVYRVVENAVNKKAPAFTDALQLGLMATGAGLAKAAGASALSIGKGLLSGAMGAGAGEFIAGPEAKEAGSEFEKEHPGALGKTGNFLLSAAPSVLGGVAGGSVLSGTKNAAKNAAAKVTSFKSIPEWAQVEPAVEGPSGIGSMSRAQQEQVLSGLKSSKYVTPEAMAKAERIENALGIKLRPGQIEAIGKKNLLSDSPLMDVEYSLARTDPAMRTYERQARAFEDFLGKKGEAMAPGLEGKSPAKIGGEIQASTIGKIKAAAQAMDDIDDLLINSAEANAHNLEPQKRIVAGLENFLKEHGATGKGQARISDDAISLTKNLIKLAKERVKSPAQAIYFKRNVVAPEAKKAFQALGRGSAKAEDTYLARIYEIFPEAIKPNGNESPELAAIMNQHGDAAKKWTEVSSPTFKTVKDLAGVINRDEGLIAKSPEKVVSDVIGKQDMGWIPKIKAAADKGLVDMNLIRQAAYSNFLEKATKGGQAMDLSDPKLVERVSKAWKEMDESTRQILFGTQSMDDVFDTLNVLTAPHRYAPNPSGTARASEVLQRGKGLLNVIPGATKVQNFVEGAKKVSDTGKAKRFFETDAYRPSAAPAPMRGTAQALDVALQGGEIGAVQARRKKRNLYR